MVYVDNANLKFGRMIMCHMIADTDEELYAMVDKIGIQRKWRHNGHFDICRSKKKLAIEYGVIEVTWRELARIVQEKRRKKSEQKE